MIWKKTTRRYLLTTLSLALGGTLLATSPWQQTGPEVADGPTVGAASLDDLRKTYDRWAEGYAEAEPAGPAISLVWNRGLSRHHSDAKGLAQFDLGRGTVSVRIKGLDPETAADVWLLDNRPGEGRSVRPEPGDGLIKLGQLRFESAGHAWLDAEVPAPEGFEVDWVVIARGGEGPERGGVLFGSTSLFQRAFHFPDRQEAPGQRVAQPSWSISGPAQAAGITPNDFFPGVNSNLINRGRNLFFNETFEGNGRTCGTCHLEDNNFTIDPVSIAALREDDPLFIVEQENRPDGTPNALFEDFRFEKPVLMRKAGLILENTNGFGDLENSFTMRASSHILSIATSIAPPPAETADDGTLPTDPDDLVFTQRTGWSGDGSPAGERPDFDRVLQGSLRDFAVGAVVQHFPRTLTRSAIPGENGEDRPDFRLPTEGQLNAMEAFMLSIGRQNAAEDLNGLELVDELADRGRLNYMGVNLPADHSGLSCNSCHFNGGANTDPDFTFPDAITPPAGDVSHNRNFAPRVEELIDQAGDVIVETVDHPSHAGDANPFDDGFGPRLQPIRTNLFNAPVVIEAADTLPFFHGHQINTVEAAVAFYSSPRHLRDGTVLDPIVPLNGAQVANVGRFMRVMNADFNARSARVLVRKALRLRRNQNIRINVRLARAEIVDAVQVLEGAQLHSTDAIPLLERAGEILRNRPTRQNALREVLQLLRAAREAMITRG